MKEYFLGTGANFEESASSALDLLNATAWHKGEAHFHEFEVVYTQPADHAMKPRRRRLYQRWWRILNRGRIGVFGGERFHQSEYIMGLDARDRE